MHCAKLKVITSSGTVSTLKLDLSLHKHELGGRMSSAQNEA